MAREAATTCFRLDEHDVEARLAVQGHADLAILGAEPFELETHAVHADGQTDDCRRKPARAAVDLHQRARFVGADHALPSSGSSRTQHLLAFVRAHDERLCCALWKPALAKARDVGARGQDRVQGTCKLRCPARRRRSRCVPASPSNETSPEDRLQLQIQRQLLAGRGRGHVHDGWFVAWVLGDQLVGVRRQPEQLRTRAARAEILAIDVQRRACRAGRDAKHHHVLLDLARGPC